jgi:hypothetical protein
MIQTTDIYWLGAFDQDLGNCWGSLIYRGQYVPLLFSFHLSSCGDIADCYPQVELAHFPNRTTNICLGRVATIHDKMIIRASG